MTCCRYDDWDAGTGSLTASESGTVTAPSPTVPTGYLYEIGCLTKHGRYVQSGGQVSVTLR